MSSCNVLQSTGSDFCGTNNFQGIFAHFRFMMFIQERINMYVDPCNCKMSFKCRCQCASMKNLKTADILK